VRRIKKTGVPQLLSYGKTQKDLQPQKKRLTEGCINVIKMFCMRMDPGLNREGRK
jgi:hypothetical protein